MERMYKAKAFSDYLTCINPLLFVRIWGKVLGQGLNKVRAASMADSADGEKWVRNQATWY